MMPCYFSILGANHFRYSPCSDCLVGRIDCFNYHPTICDTTRPFHLPKNFSDWVKRKNDERLERLHSLDECGFITTHEYKEMVLLEKELNGTKNHNV